MNLPKNVNLVQVITEISWIRSDFVSINTGNDKFHKILTRYKGNDFSSIYFAIGSAKFQQQDLFPEAGFIFDQELKITVPGEDHSTLEQIDTFRLFPLLLKITFNNTLWGDHSVMTKIMGSPSVPARYLGMQQIGSKVSSDELTFSCKAQEPVFWLQSEGVIPNPN